MPTEKQIHIWNNHAAANTAVINEMKAALAADPNAPTDEYIARIDKNRELFDPQSKTTAK